MLFLEKNFRVLFAGAYTVLVAVVIGLFSMSAFGQTEIAAQSEMAKTQVQEAAKRNSLQPLMADIAGVAIGMTRDEVKDKLGKPKIDDPDGFYYEMSGDRIMQIRLDDDKKVRVIALTYEDAKKGAPEFKDVFGDEMQIAPQPDGSVYKLVRYPEAGYWIAYSRTAGEAPSVTISMQKL